jgi:hypothetical protein
VKTIYTDKTGAMPWAWLFVGTLLIAINVAQLDENFGLLDSIGVLAGLAFYGLAINRFLQVRRAKAEGRDPTILRVKNASKR